ncbi:MAG: hypothetical protein U5J63_15990 [Fodinibius sp.]|nr:hypothetical protein [Fodinibius sp.]
MGNEIPAARQSSIVNRAPIGLITSWFNKPADLEWVRYFDEADKIYRFYSQGYVHHHVDNMDRMILQGRTRWNSWEATTSQ